MSDKVQKKRKRVSNEYKLKIILEAKKRKQSLSSFAQEHGIRYQQIQSWIKIYELCESDEEFLYPSRAQFSFDEKKCAVEDVLSGMSLSDVCKKHHISRVETLRAWVSYMKRSGFQDFPRKQARDAIETTKEERLAIVMDYIGSNLIYARMKNPLNVGIDFVYRLYELYEDFGEIGLDDSIYQNKEYPEDFKAWKNGRLRRYLYSTVYALWRRMKKRSPEWSQVGAFIRDFRKIEGYDDSFFRKKIKLTLKEKGAVWGLETCHFVKRITKKKKERSCRWMLIHEDGRKIPVMELPVFAKDFGLSYGTLCSQSTVHRLRNCDGWRAFSAEFFERNKDLLSTHYYVEAELLFCSLVRDKKFKGSDFESFIEGLPFVEGYNSETFLSGRTRLLLKDGESEWQLKNCFLSKPVYPQLKAYGGRRLLPV